MSRGDARAVLTAVESRLRTAGCETPRVDAELLLARVLGTTRSGVHADGKRTLSTEELAALEQLVARRETREPLAYVLGEWGFRRLTLQVDARVLVPRPETETVVERCLALLAGREEPRVLDVGTGSGAIALAIADEHPGARVTGIDVFPDALALALANQNAAGVARERQVTSCNSASSVAFVEHDLFTGLPDGPWDLVVSNPPYVSPADVPALPPEVRDWEPRVAVVGEGATESIAAGARDVLSAGGALVLEIGGDAAPVVRLLRDLGYAEVAVTADLTGRDRVVEGVLP